MPTPTQTALARALAQMATIKYELLWLVRLTNRAVTYPDQPADVVGEQQMRLDRATGALCLVYTFAAFEEAIELFTARKALLPDIDTATGSADLRETILAYRHLRHVAAHGFEGDRSGVTTHAQEFERTHRAGRLPSVMWDETTNRVEVDPTAWIEVQGLLHRAVENIMNGAEARKL